jgi:two-component system, NarL family, nitrate/nitrite response regulator NarL
MTKTPATGLSQGNRSPISADRNVLSPREHEVMLLAVAGFSNKEIGRQLKVTEGTIKLHLHRIYQKLGVKSRFALAALGRNMVSRAGRGQGGTFDAA